MVLGKCGGLGALFLLLLLFPGGRADGEAEGEGGGDAPADGAEEGQDKGILSQLTITLGSDVVDERSFIIRSSEPGSKKQVIRLGNVNFAEEGNEEKKEAATKALKQFAEKQMVFWKKAPDEAQTNEEKDGMPVIIADVWTIDGRHVPKAMVKSGHLDASSAYESEIAKDILMAESDENKRDSYKKLEEALKENNEEQARKAKEEMAAEEEEEAEPLGLAGYLGLGTVAILVVGAFFNFGRSPAKKSGRGSQRSKGFFASILSKFKLS